MTQPRRIAFKRIADAALRHADTLARRWLPDGRREGAEWVALNPTRSDSRKGSFKVNLTTGRWSDFATNDRGGDLIALAAYLHRLNQADAAKRVADMIGEEHGVGSWCDHLGDFREMQVHRLGVASRQDQRRALAILWADGAEDIGRSGALIAGSARARAALGPPARDLVFLADARLVLKPNFYRFDVDRLFPRDFVQARGEVFLKSSIASSAWA